MSNYSSSDSLSTLSESPAAAAAAAPVAPAAAPAPAAQAPGLLAAAIENPPAAPAAAAAPAPQPAAPAQEAIPVGADPTLPNDEDVPYRRRVVPGAAPQPLMNINIHTPPTPPLPPENPASFDHNFHPIKLRPSTPDNPGLALNLRPINIDFTLEDTYDHFSRINKQNLLYVHTGDVINQVPPITFDYDANNYLKIINNSHFRVAERNYTVVNTIGNPGAYGAAYIILGDNGQRYVMKVQKYKNRLMGNNIFKEAICQYIVNRTSFHPDHVDCSFTPAIIAVGKYQHVAADVVGAPGTYIFILMEYIDNVTTLGAYLAPHPFHIKLTKMHEVIYKIARKLQPLYRYYKFNHGDLHYGNILIQHPPGGSARTIIIDFGFTSMKIGDIMTFISPMTYLEIPGAPPAADPLSKYLTASISPGRDLTYLITSLYQSGHYGSKEMRNPMPLLEMFILQNRLSRVEHMPAQYYRAAIMAKADNNLANHRIHHLVFDLFNEGSHNNWAAPGRILRHFNNMAAPINEGGICDPILDAGPLGLVEVPAAAAAPANLVGGKTAYKHFSKPALTAKKMNLPTKRGNSTRKSLQKRTNRSSQKRTNRSSQKRIKPLKMPKYSPQSVYTSPLPIMPQPEGLPRFRLTEKNITNLSIENVFHHLRFDYAIPKELLVRLAYIPIREEMESFLLAYNGGQDKIIEYLKSRPVPAAAAAAIKSVTDVFDLYYMVKNREIALAALTSLIAQPIYTKKEWETYKEWFVNNIKHGQDIVASPTIYGAEFI